MSKAVAVSDTLYEKLEQTARSRGVTIEQLLNDLSQTLPPPNRTNIVDALSQGGLTPIPADEFVDFLDPTADYEAIRRTLAQKRFASPLSDTILAERG